MGALTEPLAVAVHDVRVSQIAAGQKALIIGGVLIGILIGLVAQYSGAEVYISEINEFRLQFMKELGLHVLNAADEALDDKIREITSGKGFDVVYEVSGSKAGQQMMTSACKIRGTIVAIGMGGHGSTGKSG
ncbi:MAG: zinc-binding dehydrogenase [Eubacterium sp.]